MYCWVQIITLPRPVEDLILQAVSINKYAIYFVLLAALLAISKVMPKPAWCRSFAARVQHIAVVLRMLHPVDLNVAVGT